MQAQGSETKITISEELTFKADPELVIEDCEDIWNEQAGTGVTASLDAADFKVGAGSAKFVMADGTGVEIIASEVVTSKDLSSYTHIVAWVKSSVNLSSADLQLLLDNTALCASPVETLNIPALVANTWTQIKLAIAVPASCTAIISIGLKQAVDKGVFSFWIDHVRAIKQSTLFFFNSESMRQTVEIHKSEAIGSGRNPKTPTRGNKDCAGDINFELQPYIGLALKNLFGSYSVAGGDPYTHTFKISSLPTGLMIEKQFTDIGQYFRYNGCKINSFKQTTNAQGLIMASFGFMGSKESILTYPFDPSPIDAGHAPFDAFEAAIIEGGSSLAYGTILDFELNNNLDGSSYVIGGAGERRYLPSGIVSISGKLSMLFEDITIYTKALNFTETALILTYSRGAGTGAADNEKLVFTFAEVKYATDAPVIPGPKGLLVELPFEAYYNNDAAASALQADLYNTVASYATY